MFFLLESEPSMKRQMEVLGNNFERLAKEVKKIRLVNEKWYSCPGKLIIPQMCIKKKNAYWYI